MVQRKFHSIPHRFFHDYAFFIGHYQVLSLHAQGSLVNKQSLDSREYVVEKQITTRPLLVKQAKHVLWSRKNKQLILEGINMNNKGERSTTCL